MQQHSLTIPEIILIAGTRVALGVGLGLLIGGKLRSDVRKGAGWALFGVGAVTTIPILMNVFSKPPVSLKRVA